MNVLVFDIETIPDVELGRKLYDLRDLSDKDVANVMFHRRKQEADNDFLRHHCHQIVAISAVLRQGDRLKVWSLGDEQAGEGELLTRFFDGIEKFAPTLVSWNGSGFDLPVLHYRALKHGIAAPRYWEVGDHDRDYRYNNYLNRYHYRHIDLMDVLSAYQGRAAAALDDIALLLGLPGKMGRGGGSVWDWYLSGDLAGIRSYCEVDVLNTYLVYLRFEKLRGVLTAERYVAELQKVRDYLVENSGNHWREFSQHWHGL